MPFYDGLLKAIGIPTEQERIEAAQAELTEIRNSQDPASRFATYHASAIATLYNGSIRKAMPKIYDEIIPPYSPRKGSHDERELFVAKALREYATHFIEKGSDGRMAPPLGRAVREHALDSLSPTTIQHDLMGAKLIDVLEQKATKIGVATESYLSVGKPHEEALDKLSKEVLGDKLRLNMLRSNTRGHVPDLPRNPDLSGLIGYDSSKVTYDEAQAWTRKALATEVAISRGGAMSPSRIVKAASNSEYQASIMAEALSHRDASLAVPMHPNFERGMRTRPDQMSALIAQHASMPDQPITKHVEQRDFREKRPEDREPTAVGLQPARTAAIGAMRDSLIGNGR